MFETTSALPASRKLNSLRTHSRKPSGKVNKDQNLLKRLVTSLETVYHSYYDERLTNWAPEIIPQDATNMKIFSSPPPGRTFGQI